VRVNQPAIINIGPSEQGLTFESIRQLKTLEEIQVSLRTVFFSMEMSADILSGPLRVAVNKRRGIFVQIEMKGLSPKRITVSLAALAILIVAGAAAGSPSPVNGSTTPPAAGPTAAAAGAVPTTTGLPPATTAVTPTRTRSRSTPPRTAASVVARHGSDRPCPHSDSTMPGDDA